MGGMDCDDVLEVGYQENLDMCVDRVLLEVGIKR